jgi:hypothetical protein
MSRDGNTVTQIGDHVSREYHGELTLNPEKSEENTLVSRAKNREHPEILKNPQYIKDRINHSIPRNKIIDQQECLDYIPICLC